MLQRGLKNEFLLKIIMFYSNNTEFIGKESVLKKFV